MAVTAAQYEYENSSRSRAWIEASTTASVGLLAVIAAVVSYGMIEDQITTPSAV